MHGPVRTAEIIASGDAAKHIKLPLIERIPSLHPPDSKGPRYAMELDTAVRGIPVRRSDRTGPLSLFLRGHSHTRWEHSADRPGWLVRRSDPVAYRRGCARGEFHVVSEMPVLSMVVAAGSSERVTTSHEPGALGGDPRTGCGSEYPRPTGRKDS